MARNQRLMVTRGNRGAIERRGDLWRSPWRASASAHRRRDRGKWRQPSRPGIAASHIGNADGRQQPLSSHRRKSSGNRATRSRESKRRRADDGVAGDSRKPIASREVRRLRNVSSARHVKSSAAASNLRIAVACAMINAASIGILYQYNSLGCRWRAHHHRT